MINIINLDEGLFSKKTNKDIKQYLKTIESKLLPELKEGIGLDITKPVIIYSNYEARYEGILQNHSCSLVFYSNHEYLKTKEDASANVVTEVYYNTTNEETAPYNVFNTDEAYDIIVSTLYSIGFETPEDREERLAKEKKAREDKLRREEQRRIKAALRQKELNKANDRLDSYSSTPKKVSANDSLEVSFTVAFNRSLKALVKLQEINSTMNITLESRSDNNFTTILECFYASPTQTLVHSSELNLDRVFSWKDLKDFVRRSRKYKPTFIVTNRSQDKSGDILTMYKIK